MELIQPFMLWGLGSILIPLIIHFWHQKKGKTLEWAATRWLQEKDQQQQRGIKLDNRLLLILRCLLIILLTFLLSQPVIKAWEKPPIQQKIHLVQPVKLVTNNFRFELEEAMRKGEPVYWVNGDMQAVKNVNQLPAEQGFTVRFLQSSINQFVKENTALNLYLINDQQLADGRLIRVPKDYQLHMVVDSAGQSAQRYLTLPDGNKLFVDPSNRLKSYPVLNPSIRFQSGPIRDRALTVCVSYKNKEEQQTVLAALRALSEVYSLGLQVETTEKPGKLYDWVMTDQEVVNPKSETLYVVSGHLNVPTNPNVIYTPEKMSPQFAERVRNGQLPEWLGDLLIRHLQLKPDRTPLTEEQLKTVFIPTAKPERRQSESLQNWILVVVIGLIGAERWLAFKKNA